MKNPFIINGYIPPELFCDREKETERIIRLLTNGNNIVLISPRRLGKSALIHHCFGMPQIAREYTTIFVDILQTTSLQEFTYLLGKAVYAAIIPKGKKLIDKFIDGLKSLQGKFSYDALSGVPSFSIQMGDITRPDFTLEEIFCFIENAPGSCIVAIDEFQQITNYPEKNVEALLRTYIQRLSNCNFIFAGSRQHLIHEIFAKQARPFYNSATIMHLDPIPMDIYSDFVIELFNRGGKIIERDTVHDIYDRFDGNTYYMQSVLNEVYPQIEPSGECRGEDIEDALEEIIDFNEGTYREILSGLSLRQKELLISIAKHEPVASITSSSFIRSNGLLSASSVQAAAKKMADLNIITKSEGRYSVTDKFLSLWLRKIY